MNDITFFNAFLNKNRLFRVLFDNLSDEIKNDTLYGKVEQYLEKYCTFNNISAEKANDIYTNFIITYNKHCKLFSKTGNYPTVNKVLDYSVNRDEYDIVLLLSVLLTPHRFRIMQILHQKNIGNKALFIGLGPGLELSLTRQYYAEIQTYDLSVNNFLFLEFSDITINTELYSGQNQNYFDAIYMIELLEHIKEPYLLLDICYKSLKKKGKIYLTTATDIPQFDHLYNFPIDHTLFEDQLKKTGFSVLYKELIPHNYLIMEIKPCNHFYILEKL